jgi:signal transduction histidine kinase
VVELHRRGEPRRLDALADHTAYRVVQESLTNAIKHSGRDLRVDIALDWLRDSVELTVLSSSSGERVAPSTGSGGYGLAGMRQRVADVGGALESGWRSPGRFWVSACIPVSGSERADRTPATEVARR